MDRIKALLLPDTKGAEEVDEVRRPERKDR